MIKNYKIENTTLIDLEFIYTLFDDSIRYQVERGFPSWKGFDKNALVNDVKNKNQYKVILDSQIGIVFSVCYTDKIIWRHRENGDAVYLHRIVVNPAFKGKKFFAVILDWTFEHAKQKGLNFIRMDTWGNNPLLIDYYKSFGFRFIENFTTPDNLDLPSHNRNLLLALLEIKL